MHILYLQCQELKITKSLEVAMLKLFLALSSISYEIFVLIVTFLGCFSFPTDCRPSNFSSYYPSGLLLYIHVTCMIKCFKANGLIDYRSQLLIEVVKNSALITVMSII